MDTVGVLGGGGGGPARNLGKNETCFTAQNPGENRFAFPGTSSKSKKIILAWGKTKENWIEPMWFWRFLTSFTLKLIKITLSPVGLNTCSLHPDLAPPSYVFFASSDRRYHYRPGPPSRLWEGNSPHYPLSMPGRNTLEIWNITLEHGVNFDGRKSPTTNISKKVGKLNCPLSLLIKNSYKFHKIFQAFFIFIRVAKFSRQLS